MYVGVACLCSRDDVERPPDRPHLLRRPKQEFNPERVAAAQERAHARRRVPRRVDRQRERDHFPPFRAGQQPQRRADVARKDRALRLAIGVEEGDQHHPSPERPRTDNAAAVVAKRKGREANARRRLAAAVCPRRWTARGGACARPARERVDEQARRCGYDDDRGDWREQNRPLHGAPTRACRIPSSSSAAEISPILCATIRPLASRK